ncbi:MAG: hypothetical protein KKG59_03300 [Nanoarchaeota archaeon]|nr:hypothetical protein [Nanoarchaeota archaeon]
MGKDPFVDLGKGGGMPPPSSKPPKGLPPLGGGGGMPTDPGDKRINKWAMLGLVFGIIIPVYIAAIAYLTSKYPKFLVLGEYTFAALFSLPGIVLSILGLLTEKKTPSLISKKVALISLIVSILITALIVALFINKNITSAIVR